MSTRASRIAVWVGGFTLVISLMVASFLAGTVLGNPVLANVSELDVSRDGMNAHIGASIVLIPRVRATFEGVEGDLHLGEQRVDFKVDGLEPGDVLAPGKSTKVVVGVTLTMADAGAILLRSAQAGKLTFDFEGTVHASVMGIPLSVPVTFARNVAL